MTRAEKRKLKVANMDASLGERRPARVVPIVPVHKYEAKHRRPDLPKPVDAVSKQHFRCFETSLEPSERALSKEAGLPRWRDGVRLNPRAVRRTPKSPKGRLKERCGSVA